MDAAPVRRSRVGIVGGSIAGCAAAIALGRLGCQVDVFERSSGALRDRGSGIAIPLPLRDELIAGRYLPSDYAHCVVNRRWWILDDGSPTGRRLWEQPGVGVHNNWGLLWRSLRAGVPNAQYHDGTSVLGFDQDADGVVTRFADGSSERFDVLIGADGYRSFIRAQLQPDRHPEYAGYVLWRGNYPDARLHHRDAIDRGTDAGAWHTICFTGGHSVVYMIPDFDDRTDPGHRRVNWAVYTPQPPGLYFDEPTSIPPGEVTPELYAHLDALLGSSFPTDYQSVIRESPIDEVSIQPIYDELVDSYVDGRVMLIGDAGAVTRPHTGSGATKALQDALCLERLGAEHSTWGDLLAVYDDERTSASDAVAELGRRIGRDQVEHTPDWGSMTPADFATWTQQTLEAQQLYFYGTADDPDR